MAQVTQPRTENQEQPLQCSECGCTEFSMKTVRGPLCFDGPEFRMHCFDCDAFALVTTFRHGVHGSIEEVKDE